jgi:hypothetical protein
MSQRKDVYIGAHLDNRAEIVERIAGADGLLLRLLTNWRSWAAPTRRSRRRSSPFANWNGGWLKRIATLPKCAPHSTNGLDSSGSRK